MDLGLVQILLKNIRPKVIPLSSLIMEEVFQRIACLAPPPVVGRCVMAAARVVAARGALAHQETMVERVLAVVGGFLTIS